MDQRKAKILVVEDADDSQMIFKASLNDYLVQMAKTVADARKLIASENFDLFVLDVSLPDGDSYVLAEELRRSGKTADKPILFVSARSSDIDKLQAFNRGADDYIVKPFSILEFQARVQAKLRSWAQQPQSRTFGALTIELDKRRVTISENGTARAVELTNLEFELLVTLTERPEVVRTRQNLLDRVWGQSVVVSDRTVDVHISNLRRKLGPLSDWIQAAHGQGYFFKPVAKKAS